MKRVFWVLLGIALLAVTGVLLLRNWRAAAPKESLSALERSAPTGETAPDIDEASRQKLEAVLQEHEAGNSVPPEISPESKAKLDAVLESGTPAPPSEEKP